MARANPFFNSPGEEEGMITKASNFAKVSNKAVSTPKDKAKIDKQKRLDKQLADLRKFTFGEAGQAQWTMDAARGIDLSPRAKLEKKVDAKGRLKHHPERIKEEAAAPYSGDTESGVVKGDKGKPYKRDETPSRVVGPKGKASEGRTAEEWAALGEMGKAKQAYQAAGGTWSAQKRRDLSAALKAGTIRAPTAAEWTQRRGEQISARKKRESKGWFNVKGSYRGKTAEEWYRAGRPGLAREALLGIGGNYLYGEKEQERFRKQVDKWNEPVKLKEKIDVDGLKSFSLEGIQPFTYVELTDPMLLSNRLSQILNKNSGLFKTATTRVFQIMQGRGIANSSIAQEAVMQAILNVAVPIATHEVNEITKAMYHNNGLTNKQIEAQNKFIYESMLKKVDGAINFNLNQMIQNSNSWNQWIVSATQMMTQAGVSAQAIDQWREMVGNMPR